MYMAIPVLVLACFVFFIYAMLSVAWRGTLWVRVLAISGIVLLIGVLVYRIVEHANRPDGAVCMSNLKQLGLTCMMYAEDYGTYPNPKTWNDDLHPKLKQLRVDVLHCPMAVSGNVPDYAMNATLGGLSPDAVDNVAETVMLFDSILGKNMHGGSYLLPDPPRHNGGHIVAFADGHVAWKTSTEAKHLVWKASAKQGSRK